MMLQSRLARELARRHPQRAAAVLDHLGLEDALRGLSRGDTDAASRVLARMSPHLAAGVLDGLSAERATELVRRLDLDVASRLLRKLGEPRRLALLESLPPKAAKALRSLLRFGENTAGALMDPEVFAIAEDLTASDALRRVREMPEQTHYNLYVVDRSQVLVGALNLRELFLAKPQSKLTDLMVRVPQRVNADADRSRIVSHPGWKEVHSLPVVDDHGHYLGALRYRTLQRLQEELFGRATGDGDAVVALGDLFATGAAALVDALTGAPVSRGRD